MKEVMNLFERCFPELFRSEASVRELAESEGMHCIEYREDSVLVGIAFYAENVIYLLAVEPRMRGRGIGDFLLAQCEAIIRNAGYERVTVGAGSRGYLAPGVPKTQGAQHFFERRGYVHSHGESGCFDMDMALSELKTEDFIDSGDEIVYRFAKENESSTVVECVRAGEEDFVPFYSEPEGYRSDRGGVFTAWCGDEVAGAILVECETAGRPIGNIGCTVVSPKYRRRGIATRLSYYATKYLQEQGLTRAMLEYTCTDYEPVYRKVGYEISVDYFMAEKRL